jgi:hypothetical protein
VAVAPVGAISASVCGNVPCRDQIMTAALVGSIPSAHIYSFSVSCHVAGPIAGAVKT